MSSPGRYPSRRGRLPRGINIERLRETAHVRVHQIWLGDRADDAEAATYSADDLMIVQRDGACLAASTSSACAILTRTGPNNFGTSVSIRTES